ncbi:MAG: DUF4350 domain-containing protein [Jatrophihabitans sp.]|uniref:DUF4350 domain-containing protein n=1 Tax=Jatrophihabitans sp. TaxID=1932789 RepID=UPI003F7DD794
MSEPVAPQRRPVWPRVRWWLVVAVVVVVGAVGVGVVTGAAGRPLAPDSAAHDGGKALAVLLRAHGVSVRTADSVDAAGGAVLVPFADTLPRSALATLRRRAEVVVLVDPSPGLLPGWRPLPAGGGRTDPGCGWAGAVAGPVDLPDGTARWSPPAGGLSCNGGPYARSAGAGAVLVVLGSRDLLRNDHLARAGAAALALNAITDAGRVRSVTWLDALADTGAPTRSVWELVPAGVERVAVWLLVVVGGLLALWRGRRFGPVVTEPLPVVVPAAELVVGHGRLYRRAGARDRAAAALRAGSLDRLVHALGLPPGAGADEVARAAADTTGLPAAGLLAGAAPRTDAELIGLAARLAELERAARARSSATDSMAP